MSVFHCARCGYLVSYHEGPAMRCPGTITATFESPGPIDPMLWREIIVRDSRARSEAIEELRRPYAPEVIAPPLIASRPPRNADEFASARQGGTIGKLAVKHGFDVLPRYWQSGRGVHGCAVHGRRHDVSFIATWKRKPDEIKWAVDVAYIWSPVLKVKHTQLGKVIRGGREAIEELEG